MRTYVKYKTDISCAEYLLNPKITKYQRSVFSQLRTGGLQLEIEVGRYRNIAANNRYCKLCNDGSIEDEFHFIMQCVSYNSDRDTLYSKICNIDTNFHNYTDETKFEILMKDYQNVISFYVCKIWKKRKHLLYNNI